MNGSGQRRIAESWHDLVMAGKYREAVDTADSMGLASVCADTDASSLMDLGDAARFAGRSDRAEIIYRELRTRFMGDERASTAAFYLGRISFDDKSAYADAARWFGTYLSERPSGSLAREASGRLVEALERSGDHARAREAAQRYLADFADGPHAPMARSIADR
jgi:transmembrane sensor